MPNFLNGIIHLTFFGSVHYQFTRDIKDENLKLVNQQDRAWSDCAQAGLALYWWQRLITFGVVQDKG